MVVYMTIVFEVRSKYSLTCQQVVGMNTMDSVGI